jgi:hypothetical protein
MQRNNIEIINDNLDTQGVSNKINFGDFKSKERTFGQNARHLVKLVSRAVLNPSESPKTFVLIIN